MEFRNNNGGSSSERKPAADGSVAPLTRQGSVYSLTFEEFQSTLGGGAGTGGSGLGKDFGSMNMDELLRSIWTAEESQAMASASASGAGPGAGAGAPPTSLQRQGSLTLPRTLSAKTVDEVWRNLVRDDPLPVGADGGEPQPHRQATLGEMTLEEFLVKAGVVREIPTTPVQPPPMQPRPVPVAPKATNSFYGNFPSANDAGAMPLGFPPVGMGDLALGNGLTPMPVGMGGGAVAVQTAVNPVDSGSKGSEDLSSPSEPMPYSFEGIVRGRRTGGGVEKVVERRQRRMIKNRESAARSRARKQKEEAYNGKEASYLIRGSGGHGVATRWYWRWLSGLVRGDTIRDLEGERPWSWRGGDPILTVVDRWIRTGARPPGTPRLAPTATPPRRGSGGEQSTRRHQTCWLFRSRSHTAPGIPDPFVSWPADLTDTGRRGGRRSAWTGPRDGSLWPRRIRARKTLATKRSSSRGRRRASGGGRR